jgi:peptidoglycan/LPS O-acetylase OafA/YrhL
MNVRQRGSDQNMDMSSAAQGANNRKENHLEWIDALRGFAAMFIIIFHSRVCLWVGFYEIHGMPGSYSKFDQVLAWLSLPVSCGGSAVMLFFLISGFCIHLPYAGLNKTFRVKPYALRRGLRIIPPYLFAVALTWLLEWLVCWMGGPAPTAAMNMLRVALMTQNYGSSQPLTNPSLWSLPVEVELYCAYIAVYYFFKCLKLSLTAIIILTGSLIASVLCLYGHMAWNYNFLHFWAIWSAGALLADWWKRGALPKFRPWNELVFLVSALVAIIGTFRQWPYAIMHYAWAIVYFHLLWLVMLGPNAMNHLLGGCCRLLARMGTVSYSAYLIHYPIFAFVGFLWQRHFGSKPASLMVPVIFSILIWPAAWLFWKFCELPFHQLSQQIGKRSNA